MLVVALAVALLSSDIVRIVVVAYWVLLFVMSLVFGSYGNEWRRNSLEKRGYQAKGTVDALSGKKAKKMVDRRSCPE